MDPSSPAAKAGFKEGDFVTEFDGQKIKDMRHLRLMVSQTMPGRKVTLKIVRDGKEKTLTATLGEMPKEGLARIGQGNRANAASPKRTRWMGLK